MFPFHGCGQVCCGGSVGASGTHSQRTVELWPEDVGGMCSSEELPAVVVMVVASVAFSPALFSLGNLDFPAFLLVGTTQFGEECAHSLLRLSLRLRIRPCCSHLEIVAFLLYVPLNRQSLGQYLEVVAFGQGFGFSWALPSVQLSRRSWP